MFNYKNPFDCTSVILLKHSHKSQSFWEMRQVQALAMADDKKEEDGEEEKEEKRGVRTACCFVTAAYPDTWRTLEKKRHREEPAFAQCSFISLFSLPVHTYVA